MRSIKLAVQVLVIAAAGAVPAFAQEAPRASAYAQVMQWPDWSGIWSPGVSGAGRTTPAPPKLTPTAQAAVDAFEAGKALGENLQTAAANCVPNGMPGIMRLPYPIEFTYSPGRVNILIETYSEIRRIYLDRPLPDDPDPFFNGHSVGHWDGDTLVVDTVGISPIVSLIPGLHATETTRFSERITRTAPDRMVDEITLIDPALFAEPYVMTQAYHLEPTWEMREYVCQENNRDAADAEGRPSLDLGDPDDPFSGLDD